MVYHPIVSSHLTVDTIHHHCGYGRRRWAGGLGATETTVREVPEGHAGARFVERRERQLIWRGIARAIVDPYATPQQRQEKVNRAVRKLLEEFPPQ